MPLGYGGKAMGGGDGGGGDTPQLQGIADPRLQEGGPYHMVGLGDGLVLAVTPEGYEAIRASIMNDANGSGVNWNSVNWNSVNWNSVNWNSVNWNSVNWNSVNWNSVNWNSVNWNSVNWNSKQMAGVNWNSTQWGAGYKTWGW